MHHVLSRSPHLILPHQLRNLSEAEYVRWLNEHGERERIKMVEAVVEWWEDSKEKEGRSEEAEKEGRRMMDTLKIVLERSRKGLEKE